MEGISLDDFALSCLGYAFMNIIRLDTGEILYEHYDSQICVSTKLFMLLVNNICSLAVATRGSAHR